MTDTGINFTQIVWMWNLCKVYGMYDYTKLRMAPLNDSKKKWDMSKSREENLIEVGFDWIPGNAYDPTFYYPENESMLDQLYADAPERDSVKKALMDIYKWFTNEETNCENNPSLKKELGFETGYNLQPDIPYPERGQ